MRTVPFATVVLAAYTGAASAQSPQYFSPSGAYLTTPVRKALGEARAIEFSRAASSTGFTARETRAIAAGIREGKLAVVGGPGTGSPTVGGTTETPLGIVTLTNTQQLALIKRTFDAVQYSWFFAKYAIIHIAVTPASPLDYKIVINGESCQPTLASTYEVPPGKTVVSITRSGKQPCAWTGAVASGQLQDVSCKLQ